MKQYALYAILSYLLMNHMASAANLVHTQTAYCSNQVYVQNSVGVDLKEQPRADARSVMKLNHRQYLCVVVHSDKHQNDGTWIQVRKIPLLINVQNHQQCEQQMETEQCNIADFPSKWLIKKPKGRKCQLLTKTKMIG